MSYLDSINFFLKTHDGMTAAEINNIGFLNARVEAFFIALTGYELGHKIAVREDATPDLDYLICKSFRVRTFSIPGVAENPAAQQALNDLLSVKLIHALIDDPKFRYRLDMRQREHIIRMGNREHANYHFGSDEWPEYLAHILAQFPPNLGWRHHMTFSVIRAYWNQAYYDCELARMLNQMKGNDFTPEPGKFDYLAIEARYRPEIFPDLPILGSGSNGVAMLEAA